MRERIATVWLAAAFALTGCRGAALRNPPAARQAVIDRPLRPGEKAWVHLPSADQAFALYPQKAKLSGVQGQVRLRCRVRPTGVLTGCAVIEEAPKGRQFGAATQRLVRLFRLEPGPYGRRVTLEVPITWRLRHAPAKPDAPVPPAATAPP